MDGWALEPVRLSHEVTEAIYSPPAYLLDLETIRLPPHRRSPRSVTA